MTAQPELVVNLWAIYDASIGMIYGLAGRAYCLHGSESEKLDMLRRLSGTDHVTAKRYRVPDRFSIRQGDGSVVKGIAPMRAMHEPEALLYEEMFTNLASELPPLMEFQSEDLVPRKQVIPDNPLCIATVLYEDEVGLVRALVSDDDRRWAIAEEKRRGRAVEF